MYQESSSWVLIYLSLFTFCELVCIVVSEEGYDAIGGFAVPEGDGFPAAGVALQDVLQSCLADRFQRHSWLVPWVTVIGLSVFSLTVRHGMPR